MRKLWQFEDNKDRTAITINEMQEDIFKAKGFKCLGEVDRKGKLKVEKEVTTVTDKKTK